MKFEDYMNKVKRAEAVDAMAKELGRALVKKFTGIDPSDPAAKKRDFTPEEVSSCMMAAAILYTHLGASFGLPPEGLIGGMLMSLKHAYPDIQVGMGSVPMGQEEEEEAPGFLHFNKKPMVC